MHARDLDGRVAVVTGALGKLGPIWTAALVGAGATVVGIDLDAPSTEPVAERGDADDGVAIARADVTDREALVRACNWIEDRFGTPEVLVNNAGIDQPPGSKASTARLEEIELGDFSQVIDVNLAGTFNAAQVFGARMARAGHGSIINIGSVYASIAPDPSLYEHLELDPPFIKPPAYGASKAAVVNLTRYLARLWGPAGVRINALSPGGVLGDQDPEFVRKYVARTPLGRMAEPEDLTGPLLFLASDASRYLTGHELRVDGGFTT